ncbi:hypothetical protein F7725_009791 [Dissostichus mawsoni]|uniref:Platelet-derived growth factor receptor-like protein n=1 Tax=Dissostichus mawsoni TaxID=36200 RepID=A0A7J5XME6_DISMA|nr:hypothetical protein F7725_009791 [Dissostichus mawsoni]
MTSPDRPVCTMKLWVVLGMALLWVELQNGTLPAPGPEHQPDPGRTMELRCKGNSIGWSYPPYLDTFNDSRLSIMQSDKYSQLILTTPSAADTGPYSCWVIICDGTECEMDHDRSYVSYIYFTDKDNLFVPSAFHFEIVYLHPDRPAVVPCRVTDPQAKVSLHREVPPEEITANGTQMTYDPSKGFVLQNPSPEQQGVFYCKAVTKGTPRSPPIPSGAPLVSLEVSPASVTGGDNVDVTCTMLGEPEGDVSFTWSYPGQDHRPVHIHTSWRLVHRGMSHTTRVSQSVLTVEDLETIDFGNYICKAKNQHGETSVMTNILSK